MKNGLPLLPALLLALSGCGEGVKEEIVILDYLAPCTGVSVRSCMVTLEPNGDRHYFYNGIEGFDYAWGYRHELLVRVDEVPDPPAEGSSLAYTLIELRAQEKVPGQSRFELLLDGGYVESQADGTFTLPDGRAITCASQALCDELDTRLATGESFHVDLSHPDDPADTAQPLVLEAVRDL